MNSMNNLNPVTLEFSEKRIYRSGLEFLMRTYRGRHRVLDKEVVQLTKKMQDFNKVRTMGEVKQFLVQMRHMVVDLETKTQDTVNQELDVVNTCQRRAEHLKSICSVYGAAMRRKNESLMDAKISKRDPDDSFESDSSKAGLHASNQDDLDLLCVGGVKQGHTLVTHTLSHQRANKLLMEHLVCMGYYNTAVALAKCVPGLWHLSLMSLCDEAASIENALKRGSLAPLHCWMEEIAFRLKNMDHTEFDFALLIFQFYLLMKKGQSMEALQFARDRILPMLSGGHDARYRTFRQAMSLLAVRQPEDFEDVHFENVGEDRICQEFRSLMRRVYGLSYPTPFALAIQLGLSNLKLADCFDERRRKKHCLVCYPPSVNSFSRHLPSMRHYESRLYCWYTGKHMNDDNRPMLLPNGYVYSREAVDLLSTANNEVRCPRSNRLFKRSEVIELFVI